MGLGAALTAVGSHLALRISGQSEPQTCAVLAQFAFYFGASSVVGGAKDLAWIIGAAREIPRPAGKSAGLWEDARDN